MTDDPHFSGMARRSAPIGAAYRMRRPGMDRGTKYLLLTAAGLGGLLLAGMVSWTMTGDHAVVIPVIEADSRPVRVKPENAGGLQVAGADDQVMGGHGAATQSMAPVAETPAPQALRAKMPPTPAPPAATAPVSEAVPLPPPATSPPPTVTPTQPASPSQAVRPAASQPGGTLVQLAALTNEQAAQSEWQRLSRRMPDLLADRQPVMQRVDRDGHTIWRLRIGGFSDAADAAGFCARVRSKGGACAIASF